MHGRPRHTRRPIRTVGIPLLGMAFLAAYTSQPPAPVPPPRVATVTMISSPNEGLVCALRGSADQRTLAPTAGHGRLDRMRGRYGQAACQAEGAFDRFAVRAPGAPAARAIAGTPHRVEWLAER